MNSREKVKLLQEHIRQIQSTISEHRDIIRQLEQQEDKLRRKIYEQCNHEMILDHTACEPCGPTARVCRYCGMSNLYG